MSIAKELNWTTASKPKFGKATEHSGAKKGKGAWDKKKTAKQTSNKGRRAGGKKEIKDQTVGDESDGPFPGSAPLFKKAAAMNWTTAEPRPCYPEEEPVEDHCNDGISPPAPGGGDDMGDEGYDEDGGGADDFMELGEDPMENAGPAQPEEGLEPDPTGEAWRKMRGNDPFPGAAKDERGGGGRQKGPRELPMSGPHDERDPDLPRGAPHQFWSQDAPHIQDALNKYLMPQLDSPDPKIAGRAREILFQGPHAGGE